MKYKHIKSGRIYNIISMNAINGTNMDDGQIMVIYEGMKRDGSGAGIFVREYNEFIEKFKPYNTTESSKVKPKSTNIRTIPEWSFNFSKIRNLFKSKNNLNNKKTVNYEKRIRRRI